jgi:hypothetical protein
VAALIKQAAGIEPVLVVGNRGEFTVWVGSDLVGEKEWPDEEIVAAAKRAVG